MTEQETRAAAAAGGGVVIVLLLAALASLAMGALFGARVGEAAGSEDEPG